MSQVNAWYVYLELQRMSQKVIQDFIRSSFPELSQPSLEALSMCAVLLQAKKGVELIAEGKRHKYFYLMVGGSAKTFYLKGGKEICTWFAFDEEVLATIKTFNDQTSNESIVLLEDSTLVQFEISSVKALAASNIELSHLLNDLLTEHALFLEEKLYQLQFMSSQERYMSLINTAPEVLQRVSLTDIASYLGVSRETLSRIRNSK